MAKRKKVLYSEAPVSDQSPDPGKMEVPAEVVAGLDAMDAAMSPAAEVVVYTGGSPGEAPEARSFEPEVVDAASSKYFEERLASLEAVFKTELAARDRLIVSQAAKLDIAADNADRLRESREKVERLEDDMNEKKEAAASAKKRYDAAVKDHFELELELDSPQQRLPFTAAIESPTTIGKPVETPITSVPEAAPEPEAAPPSGPSELWRSVPLDQLGIADELPPSIVAKLAEAGLSTMGDLADFVKPSASGHCKSIARDIPGIGKSKAEKIEAASIAFWETQKLRSEDVNRELADGVAEVEAARGDAPAEAPAEHEAAPPADAPADPPAEMTETEFQAA